MTIFQFFLRKLLTLGLVTTVFVCVSGTATSNPSTGTINDLMPPGFLSPITIDPLIGRMFYEMTLAETSDWNSEDFARVFRGGEFKGAALKSPEVNPNMPPLATRCDGGFIFLEALFNVTSAVQGYSVNGRSYTGEQDAESPSLQPLSAGFSKLMSGAFALAEKDLLKAIIINLYYDDIVKGMSLIKRYQNQRDGYETIWKEVLERIESMEYSRQEFLRCDPSSPSVRLVLAQWGAWGLTNVYWSLAEKRGGPFDDLMVGAFEYLEQPLAAKTSRIRSDTHKYVNDKY